MATWRNLERWLRPFAIPQLTYLLIGGQVAVYLLWLLQPPFLEILTLNPHAIWNGQAWRLVSWVFVPPATNPLFFALGVLFLQLMGTALESHLGTGRYNLFLLVGYLATLATAMLYGRLFPHDVAISNAYLYGSIFLAFAWLYPDFQLLIMFILPVKAKWIALLTLVGFIWQFSLGLQSFFAGGWLICATILAGNLNLLLFFGGDFYRRLRTGQRRMAFQVREIQSKHKPRHVCVVCGANNLTHPQEDFRYCPECHDTPAYCQEHLRGHVHRTATPEK